MSDDESEVHARIGIVVVSDRASAGIYEDRGGPAIRAWLERALVSPWRVETRIIPDEQRLIEETLIELVDRVGCSLVLTTGGTGPAPRDVTPEATLAVCDRVLPGFGEVMRAASLREVPTAILSRQLAGQRGRAFVINLPGKPASIATCLAAVFPAVPYGIELAGGAKLETDPAFCAAFRPAAAPTSA